MPNHYEEFFTVLYHECDPWGRMTPGAALRRVQETSTAHCNTVGLTDDVYQKTGTAFLLARISLQINQMPTPGEEVHIVTCAYPPEKAQYPRVTTFYGASGALLCEACSYWVLVDTASRRILRKPPEGFPFPFQAPAVPAAAHSTQFEKPTETAPQVQLVAAYSLCDKNGHINNARYADLVCDHLPLPLLQSHPIKQMLLIYRAEIALGEAFSFSGTAAGDNCYYFEAEKDGKRHFEAYIAF